MCYNQTNGLTLVTYECAASHELEPIYAPDNVTIVKKRVCIRSAATSAGLIGSNSLNSLSHFLINSDFSHHFKDFPDLQNLG